MKTTIDLADDLAATLKKQTAESGLSMRAAIHEALRLWLESQTAPAKPPRIAREVGLVHGKGLSPEAAASSWDQLRELSYSEPS